MPKQFLDLDTDGTLANNSDVYVPSQKAVKTYVDSQIGVVDQTFDGTSQNAQSGIAIAGQYVAYTANEVETLWSSL